jgi:hypothetical protein
MNLRKLISRGQRLVWADDQKRRPRTILHAAIGLGIATLCMLPATPVHAQGGQSVSAIPKPEGYIIPAANRPPDANDRLLMSDRQTKNQNFDKANAERMLKIADETAKLLILTEDLKARMDKIGRGPYPPEVAKEMQVIELLAHDVQEKMKLSVGGS